jgi:hypothetical protein
MVSMNLSSRECDGRAVVVLRGELDVADAASVAAALTAVAARVGQAAGRAGRSPLMAGPMP